MSIDGSRFAITATLSQWLGPTREGSMTVSWRRVWTIAFADGREVEEVAARVVSVPWGSDGKKWQWSTSMPSLGTLSVGVQCAPAGELTEAWNAADAWLEARLGGKAC